MSSPTPRTAPPPTNHPAVWPAGAASRVTDLDGAVHHLDLGGPPGATVVVDGRVAAIDSVVNPDKLAHLQG